MRRISCKFSHFLKKTDYRHYICVAITLGFICINIFLFPYSGPRLYEALRDLVFSFWHVIVELFELAFDSHATVTDLSAMPFTVSDKIPATWEIFTSQWSEFWAAFASLDHFKYFVYYRRSRMAMSSKIFLLAFMSISLVVLCIVLLRRKRVHNNRYNEDTKALKAFKKISDKTYRPVKKWLKDFYSFVLEHKFYIYVWLIVWAQSFNLFSVIVEFFAFYFYFAVSLNPAEIFVQLYKLILDLSPMYKFVPFPCWFLLGLWIFFRIRKKIGYKVLQHHEAMNCGFIQDRGVFSLFVAPMRQGKTKASVSFALSKEAMFRDMAYDIILKSDLKFPFFPWINLENAIRAGMANGSIYNLASIRQFVKLLKNGFYCEDKAYSKSIRRYLNRRYNYGYHNFSFDYDLERYPVEYDNAKYIEDLFDVVRDYALAYFVYVIRSSLILSNYAIRTDGTMYDVGNFPLWDTDFFHVKSYDVDVISRHSHILDYDVLRLGRKVVAESAFAFEFGIIDITELGKERLNMLEAQGLKKDDEVTNQKNDGFDNWLKMCGHNANIAHTSFVSVYADDQREDQLPASLRQVGEILRIEKVEKGKLAMPWYFVEDTIYAFLRGRFERLHQKERFNRGDNTLPYYIAHSFMGWVEAKHERIYNTFGYELMQISIQDGMKNNEKTLHKYFISDKKDLSKRYSTDCLSDTLAVRALRAVWGLDNVKTYASERATYAETLEQNSYFIRDITEQLRNPETYIPKESEDDQILFVYVDGDDVKCCEARNVADLYPYFTTAIGAMDEKDYSAVLLRLQKYTGKTDPFLNIREWLSGLYVKGNMPYKRFFDLSKQIDLLQVRCAQR